MAHRIYLTNNEIEIENVNIEAIYASIKTNVAVTCDLQALCIKTSLISVKKKKKQKVHAKATLRDFLCVQRTFRHRWQVT